MVIGWHHPTVDIDWKGSKGNGGGQKIEDRFVGITAKNDYQNPNPQLKHSLKKILSVLSIESLHRHI